MTSSKRHQWTLKPTRHVRFTGRLRLTSALHIGSGSETAGGVDAGVVRRSDGQPYIPGSSLKGVLRSHLERLAQADGLEAVSSCGLYEPFGDRQCPTPTWIEEGKDSTRAEEADFEKLCYTCTLFGSPILAGKVRLPDLDLKAHEADPTTFVQQTEVRNGVGINRDSGQAQPGVLYDFEVVPPDTVFGFDLMVDSPDKNELGLLCAGLQDLCHGRLPIGGKTTRGLGHCVLEQLTVTDHDFSTPEGLKAHLLRQEAAPQDGADYLHDHINDLFT